MKRIYLVNGRLIRAASREQAICFAAQVEYKAVIPTQDELLNLVQKGVKVENARSTDYELPLGGAS